MADKNFEAERDMRTDNNIDTEFLRQVLRAMYYMSGKTDLSIDEAEGLLKFLGGRDI